MDTNALVEKYVGDMVATRREIHAHPELSNQEFETTRRIEDFLKECGIEVLDVGMKTGCIALLRGGKPGKTVGLREDIDALPIVEQTGLPFCVSVRCLMHACGREHPSDRFAATAVRFQRSGKNFTAMYCSFSSRRKKPCTEHWTRWLRIPEKYPRMYVLHTGLHCSPDRMPGPSASSKDRPMLPQISCISRSTEKPAMGPIRKTSWIPS